jgi:hypothetical protein
VHDGDNEREHGVHRARVSTARHDARSQRSDNPDLRAFAAYGGKLIIWQGWADSGTSLFGTLNYYAAVKKLLGDEATARFLALFIIPGMYHCAGALRRRRSIC